MNPNNGREPSPESELAAQAPESLLSKALRNLRQFSQKWGTLIAIAVGLTIVWNIVRGITSEIDSQINDLKSQLNERIDNLGAGVNKRIDNSSTRVDDTNASLNSRIDNVITETGRLNRQMGTLTERVDNIKEDIQEIKKHAE